MAEKAPAATTDESDPNNGKLPPTHRCKICGDVALHSNYGAMTCSPCKMFFKRNAVTGREKFQCDFGGNCEVNLNNRHVCSACRLKKCFDEGMQIELIRCQISRRGERSQRFDPMRAASTRVSNILTNISPLASPSATDPPLNLTETNLLMTLIANYDCNLALTLARRITDQATLTLTIDPNLAQEFLQRVYRCTESYLRTNSEFSSLPSDDRSIILRSTAENVTCLGSLSIWHQSQLIECPSFLQIYIDSYGIQSIEYIRSILNRLDRDIDLIKLSIPLFAFSNHLSLISSDRSIQHFNSERFHQIQNSYVDLTWKYLRTKYSYQECIQRWMNLLRCFLNGIKMISAYRSIDRHVQQIESLVEETELNFVLAEIEEEEKK